MIAILPAAFFALLLASAPGAKSWRDASVRAAVIFGAAVALLTESLGAFGLLRPFPLVAAWSAVTAGALAFGHRRRAAGLPAIPRPRTLFEPLAAASLAAIAALVGIVALAAAPNSTDALAYHLPRVVYWAQAGSVAFFPTTYFNQIMLQPLAEYFVLHTYVLSGGDRFANLVQFLGFCGAIAAVSLIARELGANGRGQAVAALFCATIPNGILQASGAKNEWTLALWLAAMTFFALRLREEPGPANRFFLGSALGLALMTKGTAYIFAPVMLACVFAPVARKLRREWPRIAAALVLGVLLLNGPQYCRNIQFSGSPLGFDSAHGDGAFRWRNERFGPRVTASNILRNLSEHLAARSTEWNRAVYTFVVEAHHKIGADPDDPATTWRWTRFQPPVNSNHEANAPNRWHLLLLIIAAIPLALSARHRGQRAWLWYYLGIAGGFVLFCSYLKWQPYFTRMHLPLFALASPVAAHFAAWLRVPVLQAALALFLLNNTRPYLFENWTRPLRGQHSVLRVPRDETYFSDLAGFADKQSYLDAVARTRAAGCAEVGIDDANFPLEYPYLALLRKSDPRVHFQHVGVTNVSARYAVPQPAPCAVLCLNCAGNPEKARLHAAAGTAVQIGRFLLFLPPG